MSSETDHPSHVSPVTGIVTTGLMLFALFFGAGNLIFPPLLGAASGSALPVVMAGFLTTGVLLPLATVVAVSTSGEGILGLARRVGPRFGVVMPLAVYLSIGPLYAIPRVATVAYELATRPVLELMGIPDSRWTLVAHVTLFLGLSVLISLRPSRLADRIGRWLTPALLALLALLCGATLLSAQWVDRDVIEPYANSPFPTGLTQGYLTMDVLSASVFGIVVISSLRERGFTSPGRLVRGTTVAGGIAAVLLGAVYAGLALIGTRTPGIITADTTDGTELTCQWCGQKQTDWSCATCGATTIRSGLVGASTTAEQLGQAFPDTTLDAIAEAIHAGLEQNAELVANLIGAAITPATASQPRPASTAAFSTPNLAKKPSIGGTPVRLNSSTVMASAFSGSARASRFRSSMAVTGRPLRSIDRMKAKVPTFITT